MRPKAVIAARILLGLIFLAFGLNGFLHLFPVPAMEGAAATFVGGLLASRYFFPLLFATYIISGAALLSGRFVPLALIVLAPVIVNIAAIHLFLDPSGLLVTAVVVALEVFLAWSHRGAFRPLLRAGEDAASVEAR